MTAYGDESEWHGRRVAGEDAVADGLIDLRSLLDNGGVDYYGYEEQRARLLGF